MEIKDNETLDITIDDLFKDDFELNQPETDNQEDKDLDNKDEKPTTEAVSKRINEVRKKTELETQDKIAKELGFESYADLQKSKEKQLIKDAGLDEEDVSAVVDKLVEKRLASDPRFKKLEEYEEIEKRQFVDSQLKEINKLTGNNFTSVEDLPQDTLKMWEKTGNLKQAYLATRGEELLLKNESIKQNGTLAHLANHSGNGTHTKSRPLSEEEKAIWRSVMPDITEEELSKKTTDLA